MAIVSSTCALGHPQADGRRYVAESHTDSAGGVHRREYGPVGEVDYAAILAARAQALGAELAEVEAGLAFEQDAAPVLVHQTAVQLAARFREAYRNASDIRQARMATWLLARIVAGHFTDAQVRNAFGLTVTQYNNLKARMTTLRDQYAAVMAARGE
jgi:hypothetical protein